MDFLKLVLIIFVYFPHVQMCWRILLSLVFTIECDYIKYKQLNLYKLF